MFKPIAIFVGLSLTVMPVSAMAADRPDGPYGIAPVSDLVLDDSFGTALPGFARNVRALSDQTARTFLREVGETGRIAMDNWWAQTGAALIANNLLARPVIR